MVVGRSPLAVARTADLEAWILLVVMEVNGGFSSL